ncbi:hypothetical protein [Corynebacterium lizhenjunii]|uniref:hypothetical protein n=1 Tax=Corynebacterium lizhenjunii TaxID=2709394 RepID=UPI0013EB004B|nr:hypothetical protein [Corynebacterium lizhenjunii]
MKIRDDLDGTVYVHTPDGVVVLAAGDEVPDGGRVDAVLVVGAKPAAKATASKRGGRRAAGKSD